MSDPWAALSVVGALGQGTSEAVSRALFCEKQSRAGRRAC